MNKKELSERDICTKFITPALRKAGWDELSQLREEVSFTKGRIIVRGKMVTRGKAKRADYILYYKPNIPLAVIEAKDNTATWATASRTPRASPARRSWRSSTTTCFRR
jgi:type I restriction enzyme, R subunit